MNGPLLAFEWDAWHNQFEVSEGVTEADGEFLQAAKMWKTLEMEVGGIGGGSNKERNGSNNGGRKSR